jgi:hypothetical protein
MEASSQIKDENQLSSETPKANSIDVETIALASDQQKVSSFTTCMFYVPVQLPCGYKLIV